MINGNKVITFIGQNTLVVLGLSGVSLFILRGISYVLVGKLPILEGESIARYLIWSIFQLMLLMPAMVALNRYCPVVLGRQVPAGRPVESK